MLWFLFVLCLLFAGAAAGFGYRLLKNRARRKQRFITGPWPIPTRRIEEVEPRFAPDELGPTRASEVFFIGKGHNAVKGGANDDETWILCVLARQARDMFEFGTCTGKTAYLWARNSAPGARVTTITLDPGTVAQYRADAGDMEVGRKHAEEESIFERFYYSGTDVEAKVTQLFGDSKALDETPYLGRFDLIFVDGSHAYSYVKSDTQKALRMLAPGGLLLWHDFRPKMADVFRYLCELSATLPLTHIQDTNLVVYRKPG
jgi:SAM-dependent methyltransferase